MSKSQLSLFQQYQSLPEYKRYTIEITIYLMIICVVFIFANSPLPTLDDIRQGRKGCYNDLWLCGEPTLIPIPMASNPKQIQYIVIQ